MATQHATAQDARYVLVCISPDVCWTPIGDKQITVPYFIIHKMDQSKRCSPNVFIKGKAAFLHKWSYVNNVQGDETGTRGGIITKVHNKVSHSKKYSDSVFANGKQLVRTGDLVKMNTKKP